MLYIISEQQFKIYKSQDPNKPLSRFEIKILKTIHEEKKDYTTRDKLIKRIEYLLPFLNINPKLAQYFYELYRANYRKKGDFENITKEDYVDPQQGRGKTTSNTNAWKYSIAQLPFRGQNITGFWGRTNKGEPVYIINSYDWYPIYIFKDGKWYQTSDRYSSSTGRQMSNVNPHDDDNLETQVYLLTKDEMKQLLSGLSHDELMKNKINSLLSQKDFFLKKRVQRVTTWGGENWNGGTIHIKYKIKDIVPDGDFVKMKVDITDVVSKRKPELNYLKGEMPGVTKEYVETRATGDLKSKLKEFIGATNRHYYKIPENTNVKFEFNHTKGQ